LRQHPQQQYKSFARLCLRSFSFNSFQLPLHLQFFIKDPARSTTPIYLTTHLDSNTKMADSNPGNFANRPTEEVRAIASKGGKASHGGRGGTESAEDTESSGGGSGTGNTNPGNFANRPHEEVVAAASKGGKSS
jgi:hypothetical protein